MMTARAQSTAAELLLEALAAHGVGHFFANAGTDFPPIVEAFARGAETGRAYPRPMVVPHENVAVSMAHGYYLVTGKPQAVMVHVNVGTANCLNNLINAARDNVPILLLAGRTPVTERGRKGARSRPIHWAQEMFDQAGMLREIVKWDYELRYPEQAADAVRRAVEIAMTPPRGPVYLVLPREALAGEVPAGIDTAPRPVPAALRPDPQAVAQLADWIAAAEFPVVITSAAGRDPAAVPVLARLAERFGVGIVAAWSRYLNLPASHPMHLGYAPGDALREADLLVVLECDVPWFPHLESPRTGARVAHVGIDPTFARYPMRSFPSDLSLAGDPRLVLEALEAALAARADDSRIAPRRASIAARSQALREAARARAHATDPITPEWISRCVGEAIGDDAIVVNEYPLRLEHCPLERPGTYFGLSPAGGLGWGLGAALGAKLAAPERLVVATLGDGAYVFANPTAGHWCARAYGLPILAVVFNNSRWAAVRNSTVAMYRDGVAARSGGTLLADLSPSPDYAKLVEAHGGYGERVDRAEAVPAALARAIAETRRGRQALLDVVCEY
jgi:acetolactate synthase-1/2/3 large subunit